MIQVGIVGSLTAIGRYTNALGQFQDAGITGRWISGSGTEPVTDAETGRSCTSTAQLIGNSDALIIEWGGEFCTSLAIAALRSARHVFLHSSAVQSVDEANRLIKLAREANVILRAGKSGKDDTKGLLTVLRDRSEISMIELQHDHRINGQSGAPGMPEALLADLEVISSLVKARIVSVKAKGLCMLSSNPDIVNARLEFDNGCAVNYNCNLVAAHDEFRGTLVLKKRILKYNFLTGEITSWLLQPPDGRGELLSVERIRVENSDTLISELSDFFNLIISGPNLLSLYDNGFEPYVLADRILEKVMKTLVRCS